jgi:hypothetical protein
VRPSPKKTRRNRIKKQRLNLAGAKSRYAVGRQQPNCRSGATDQVDLPGFDASAHWCVPALQPSKKAHIEPKRAGASGALCTTCACGAVTARSPSISTVNNIKRLIIRLLAIMATAHRTIDALCVRSIECSVSLNPATRRTIGAPAFSAMHHDSAKRLTPCRHASFWRADPSSAIACDFPPCTLAWHIIKSASRLSCSTEKPEAESLPLTTERLAFAVSQTAVHFNYFDNLQILLLCDRSKESL